MKNKEQRKKIQGLIRRRFYDYISAWLYGTPQEQLNEVCRRISECKKTHRCSTIAAIYDRMAHDGVFRFCIAYYEEIKSIYDEAAPSMPMDTFIENFPSMCLSELERIYNEHEDANGETAF